MGPFLDRFFEPLGWARGDVDVLVPHQASRHAALQLSRRLGFRENQVYMNLAERGNCVAAAIPLALVPALVVALVQPGWIGRLTAHWPYTDTRPEFLLDLLFFLAGHLINASARLWVVVRQHC